MVTRQAIYSTVAATVISLGGNLDDAALLLDPSGIERIIGEVRKFADSSLPAAVFFYVMIFSVVVIAGIACQCRRVTEFLSCLAVFCVALVTIRALVMPALGTPSWGTSQAELSGTLVSMIIFSAIYGIGLSAGLASTILRASKRNVSSSPRRDG